VPIEIVICIVAGCGVAIFSGVGNSGWKLFKKKPDAPEENQASKD
jgi:hypothetical protein